MAEGGGVYKSLLTAILFVGGAFTLLALSFTQPGSFLCPVAVLCSMIAILVIFGMGYRPPPPVASLI